MKSNASPTHAEKPSLPLRALRGAIYVLLAIASAMVALWLGRLALVYFVVPVVVEDRVRELGRLTGWPRDLVLALTICVVLVASFLAGFVLRLNRRQRWLGLAGLGLLATTYFVFHAWCSRDHLFGPNGEPLFYWAVSPTGRIHRQATPGLNPWTKEPLLPASAEYLALIRSRLRQPLAPVDPATNDWFNVNTGWPLLWCLRTGSNQFTFFNRPGWHPTDCVELKPVTPAIRAEWLAGPEGQRFLARQQQAQAEREAAEARAARAEEARLAAQRAKADRETELAKARREARSAQELEFARRQAAKTARAEQFKILKAQADANRQARLAARQARASANASNLWVRAKAAPTP